MRAGSRRLIRNGLGAVAPTVALSLFALIGVGGLAFDYARLASMDTELQSAADQAALAAATQLDGDDGACGRAIQAATARLAADAPWLANETRFANDGDGLLVQTTSTGGTSCTGHPNVTFWQDEDMVTPADGDNNANFVQVQVEAREANYALTPVIGIISSGAISARALAGMQGSFCRIPPMMICNPAEGTDDEFDGDDYAGKGILLKARGGGNAWAPGDFGFLAAGYDFSGGAGANVLRRVLGQENALIECVSGSRVTTEPGNMENVVDALNTRFDIYAQGGITNVAICGSGQCPPDPNTRSDLVRPNTPLQGQNCRLENNPPNNWNNNGTGWTLPPANQRYFAETASQTNLASMGLPRDRCHASLPQNCPGGRIGNGTWDRDAYFRTNYGWADEATWTAQTGLNASAKRFDVYQWELTQPRDPRAVSGLGVMYAHNRPICQAAPAATTDRRKLTVAVINCNGLAGRQTRRPVSWVEVFLLEPSVARDDAAGNVRTQSSDVYVEVIGKAEVVGDAGVASVVRSVPYLVQ